MQYKNDTANIPRTKNSSSSDFAANIPARIEILKVVEGREQNGENKANWKRRRKKRRERREYCEVDLS